MLLMVEIKTDSGVMTEREAEVWAETRHIGGDDAPYVVARCVEDVLEWFGAL